MNSRDLHLRLLAYVRPQWRTFAFSLLMMVLLAATEPVLHAMMKPLLDGSFVEMDPDIIRWMPLALIALFVAHGLATIEMAERILVLERGQIVESGSHAELLTKGGCLRAFARPAIPGR
jgi:ABC-type multidrug transport system fused ATPase/permease subunit